jgi:hypothetical protein
MPDLKAQGGDSGATRSAIPFHQHLRAMLLSKLHYTEAMLDTVPLNQALWDYYSWAAFEGLINLFDCTAGDMQAEADALDRESVLAKAREMSRF